MTPKRYALVATLVCFMLSIFFHKSLASIGYILFLATTLICWQLERNNKK